MMRLPFKEPLNVSLVLRINETLQFLGYVCSFVIPLYLLIGYIFYSMFFNLILSNLRLILNLSWIFFLQRLLVDFISFDIFILSIP